MFQSLSPSELVVIGLVALIVVGPHRLPEMARKVGSYVADLRSAVADIRKGLDAEVQQLKEPLDAVKRDLTKPVSEIKESLAQTADALKKSTAATTESLSKMTEELKAAGDVQWVGPEPETGISPKESWGGMDEPVPDAIGDLPTELDEVVTEDSDDPALNDSGSDEVGPDDPTLDDGASDDLTLDDSGSDEVDVEQAET
jgi:sec-independent protein translocase protein TatB